MRFDTELLHFDASPGDPCRPVSTPIYQTATFEQPGPEGGGAFDYSRSGNPTRAVLERQLARLERGARGLAFASGMAALANVARLLRAGDEIVAGRDLYGGTFRLLAGVLPAQGISVRWADTTDRDAVAAALGPRTRLVLVESPSNPRLEVSDLRALAAAAHDAGALLVADNSLLSPRLQRPLELGADLVVHSATKWLGGHADVTAGAVIAREPGIGERLAWFQNAEGNALGPFDSWLLLRGLKTLSLRVERQQRTARRLARRLAAHPAVTRVHWPGFPGSPARGLLRAQARGPGAVLSFETGSEEASLRIVRALRRFKVTVSFGSVGSTASLPCRMSHASVPPELRDPVRLPPDLVRLSAGIEDPRDLEADLARALGVSCATEPVEDLGDDGPP